MDLTTAILNNGVYSWNIGNKTFRYQLKYKANHELLFSTIYGVSQIVKVDILNPECDYTFTSDVFSISFKDITQHPFTEFESLEIFLIDV